MLFENIEYSLLPLVLLVGVDYICGYYGVDIDNDFDWNFRHCDDDFDSNYLYYVVDPVGTNYFDCLADDNIGFPDGNYYDYNIFIIKL